MVLGLYEGALSPSLTLTPPPTPSPNPYPYPYPYRYPYPSPGNLEDLVEAHVCDAAAFEASSP